LTLFEYLGVLLSVVVGLAVTHVLTGVSKTIQHRDTVKVYPLHLGWAVNVLIYIIAIWWGMFWWSNEDAWSFFQFLFIILYAIVLFLLASLLYPFKLPDDYNFEEHFYRNRTWFFGIQVAAWMVDIPETWLKAQDGLRALPSGYPVFVGVLMAMAVVGAWTDSRPYHRFYVVAWPVWVLGYLSLTTLTEIVVPLGG
jgi:hypothetical protein